MFNYHEVLEQNEEFFPYERAYRMFCENIRVKEFKRICDDPTIEESI
jgi:hypothetical protein